MSKIEKNEARFLWIAIGISFFLAISFVISKTVFWTSFFILISSLLWYLSLKLKHKLLFRLLSLFVFLHFLLFPYLYAVTIKIDPNSFQIQQNVTVNEQKEALNEIFEFYSPKELKIYIQIIDSVISSHDLKLDSNLQRINNENIICLDNYLIHKSSNRSVLKQPMPDDWTLVICKSNGDFIYEFETDKFDNALSLKEVLSKQKEILLSKLGKYTNKKEKIDNYKIWSYKRILWYSINIIELKNLLPISKFSNFLFFMHRIIIVFLIALIGTTIFHVFLKDKILNQKK